MHAEKRATPQLDAAGLERIGGGCERSVIHRCSRAVVGRCAEPFPGPHHKVGGGGGADAAVGVRGVPRACLVHFHHAGDLRGGDNLVCLGIGRWLAAGIGIFWLIRWLMQFFYYDSSHWRGKRAETIVHIFLYGSFAGVYLLAAFQGQPVNAMP